MHSTLAAALAGAASAVFFLFSTIGEPVMAQSIEMRIGEKTFPIELNGNDAARSFASRLPVKLQFEDFGRTERIAYLNPKLEVGDAPTRTNPVTGDITYYIPWGNIAVFVRDFRPSESLVPLGRLTEEARRAIAESGDKVVEFRRAGN